MGLFSGILKVRDLLFGNPEENRRRAKKREEQARWDNRQIVEIIHRYPNGKTKRQIKNKLAPKSQGK